jgi:hypothetical protein
MIHLPEAILHLHVVHPISKEVPVMINQSTVETLRSMRLSAMAQSFEDQLNNSATYSSLSFLKIWSLYPAISGQAIPSAF